MTKKHWVIVRSLVLAVALAFLGGYLNELGVQLFPRYEKYVDNAVAIIIVIPLIYLVFVPVFGVISREHRTDHQDEPPTQQ